MQAPNEANNNGQNGSQHSALSVLIIEDEQNFPILLKYTVSKNMFLTKVSFYFMLYMVFISSICIMIFENRNLAKLYYRLWFLNFTDIFVFIIWLAVKVMFFLFGKLVRKMASYLFYFDCFISMLATLSLYFRMDNFLSLPYIYTGHYLIIYITCFAMSSIAFFVTTIYRNGAQIYSVGKGVLFMSLCNLIPIMLYQEKWKETFMTYSRYLIVWLSMVVVNFYLARNSWLLVNCRGDKFYDHEHIYAFECYFTDIFWHFWTDTKDEKDRRKSVSFETGSSGTPAESSNARESRDEEEEEEESQKIEEDGGESLRSERGAPNVVEVIGE